AKAFDFEHHVNWIEADSLEEFTELFMDHFPTAVTAHAMLGERFGELREQMVSIWRNANVAEDGRLRVPQEYLLSIVRRRPRREGPVGTIRKTATHLGGWRWRSGHRGTSGSTGRALSRATGSRSARGSASRDQ